MKKILSILALILVIVLAACDDNAQVELKIDGIKGHTDAVIDNENKSISFNVDNSIATFDVADILLPEMIDVNVYSDEAHQNSLEGNLNLEVGLNTYYLNIYYTEDSSINENWKLEITRLNIEVGIKNIAVKELKSTYALNESLASGTLLVTYLDESTKEVAITSDMVSGFDTSKVGSGTMRITYNGQFVDYPYIVGETIDEIVSVNTTVNYYVGEAFKGGTITVKIGDTTKEITIIDSMVSGFDSSKPGQVVLKITYLDKVKEIVINVVNKPESDFEMPEETTIVFDNIKDDFVNNFANIMTIIDPSLTIDSAKEMLEGEMNSEVGQEATNNIISIIQKVGLSETEVKEIIALLADEDVKVAVRDFAEMVNQSPESNAEMMSLLIGFYEKHTNTVLSVLKQIKSYLDDDQLTVLVVDVLIPLMTSSSVGSGNEQIYYYLIDMVSEPLQLTYEALIAKLEENPELSIVVDFINKVNNYEKEDITLEYSEAKVMVSVLSDLIDILVEHPTEFLEIVKGINSIANSQSGPSMEDLANLAKNAAVIIDELYKQTNGFLIADDIAKIYINMCEYHSYSDYLSISLTTDLFVQIAKNLDVVADIAKDITASDIEVIMYVINSMQTGEFEGDILIKASKILLPLAERIKNTPSLSNAIGMYLALEGMPQTYVSQLVDLIIETAAKAEGSIDAAGLQEIMEEIQPQMDGQIQVSYKNNGSVPLVKKGSSDDEIINVLNDSLEVIYFDYTNSTSQSNPIIINKDNIRLSGSSEVGYKLAYLTQGNITQHIVYFVYENESDFEVVNMSDLTNLYDIVYFMPLNGDTLAENGMYKATGEIIRYASDKLNYLSGTIKYKGTNCYFTVSGDRENTTYIVDSSSVGLKDGYIKVSGITDLYFPIQVYVYDEENPIYTYYDIYVRYETKIGEIYGANVNDENIVAIPQNSTIYDLQITDVMENYIFYADENDISISKDEIVSGLDLDTSVVGLQKATLNYNGMNINIIFDVYSENEKGYIFDMYSKDYLYLLKDDPDLSKFSFYVETYCGTSANLVFSDIEEYIQGVYPENTTLDIDYNYENKVVIKITNEEKNINKQFSFDAFYLDASEYYDFYLNFNNNKYFVDDYADFNLIEFINSFETMEIYYNNLNVSYIYTGDNIYEQIINDGFTITIDNTYDSKYYRSYYLTITDKDGYETTQYLEVGLNGNKIIDNISVHLNEKNVILYGIPTEENVLNLLVDKIYIKINYKNGYSEEIYGQEAINIINQYGVVKLGYDHGECRVYFEFSHDGSNSNYEVIIALFEPNTFNYHIELQYADYDKYLVFYDEFSVEQLVSQISRIDIDNYYIYSDEEILSFVQAYLSDVQLYNLNHIVDTSWQIGNNYINVAYIFVHENVDLNNINIDLCNDQYITYSGDASNLEAIKNAYIEQARIGFSNIYLPQDVKEKIFTNYDIVVTNEYGNYYKVTFNNEITAYFYIKDSNDISVYIDQNYVIEAEITVEEAQRYLVYTEDEMNEAEENEYIKYKIIYRINYDNTYFYSNIYSSYYDYLYDRKIQVKKIAEHEYEIYLNDNSVPSYEINFLSGENKNIIDLTIEFKSDVIHKVNSIDEFVEQIEHIEIYYLDNSSEYIDTKNEIKEKLSKYASFKEEYVAINAGYSHSTYHYNTVFELLEQN